jgi:hypothetical protein
MSRFSVLSCAFLFATGLALTACGGDDSTSADGGPDGGDIGRCEVQGGAACFVPPTVPMTVAGGAAANFSCAAPTITVSTQEIAINGLINDFQTSTKTYEGATLDSFINLDFAGAPTATTTSAAGGAYTITIPAGGASTYMNFRTRHPDVLDTIGTLVQIDVTAQTQTHNRSAVSKSTATSIPALLGVTRTPGTGVLAGEVIDCDGKDVLGAIATVSSVSGVNHVDVPGMQMYYFTSGLPVRRTAQPFTNDDGLFVAIQVPAASSNYFVQVWGYKTAGDLSSENLTLVSEVEIPALADTVVSANMYANVGL